MPTLFLKQVHSARVITVEKPFAEGERPEADAMVTDRKGLRLGIVTADCVPVLLVDAAAGVIGAAHAGWRGALGGVLDETVQRMTELGASPERIIAAIGPAIAPENYEVDAPFCAQFSEVDRRMFFSPGRENHWQFDLPGYVGWRLSKAGVGMCDHLRIDTYANEVDFHSYRRATHRGEPADGRQYSLIALPE